MLDSAESGVGRISSKEDAICYSSDHGSLHGTVGWHHLHDAG